MCMIVDEKDSKVLVADKEIVCYKIVECGEILGTGKTVCATPCQLMEIGGDVIAGRMPLKPLIPAQEGYEITKDRAIVSGETECAYTVEGGFIHVYSQLDPIWLKNEIVRLNSYIGQEEVIEGRSQRRLIEKKTIRNKGTLLYRCVIPEGAKYIVGRTYTRTYTEGYNVPSYAASEIMFKELIGAFTCSRTNYATLGNLMDRCEKIVEREKEKCVQ